MRYTHCLGHQFLYCSDQASCIHFTFTEHVQYILASFFSNEDKVTSAIKNNNINIHLALLFVWGRLL